MGPRHRQLRASEVVERMAEGIDPAVLHEGYGARPRHGQIALDQAGPDRVAGLQRKPAVLVGGRAGAQPADDGDQSGGPERRAPEVVNLRREAAQDQGRGDRPQQRAEAPCVAAGEAGAADVAGPAGERFGRRQRLRQHVDQRGGRRRDRPRRRGGPPAGRAQGGRVGRRHLLYRRDAGDGLPREGPQRVRDGPHEPIVDVDGAAAHAPDDAGPGERAALEPGDDERAPGPEHVGEDAEHVHVEPLARGAVEHGDADAPHPGLDVVDRHPRGRGRQRRQSESGEGDARGERRQPGRREPHRHGISSVPGHHTVKRRPATGIDTPKRLC